MKQISVFLRTTYGDVFLGFDAVYQNERFINAKARIFASYRQFIDSPSEMYLEYLA